MNGEAIMRWGGLQAYRKEVSRLILTAEDAKFPAEHAEEACSQYY